MTASFRNRRFSPTAFSTLLTLVGIVIFVRLGFWQLDRAEEKRALLAQFAAGQQATIDLSGRAARDLQRYQRVRAQGSYDSQRQVLLDNMPSMQGQPGYRVLTPLLLDDGRWFLVDRGWTPLGASRETKPEVAVNEQPHTVVGQLDHLPEPGVRLGDESSVGEGWPRVLSFPKQEQVERALGHPIAQWIIVLDPNQPDGYERTGRLSPQIEPARHIAYAVQWFAFAAAAIALYLFTNLKAIEPHDGR